MKALNIGCCKRAIMRCKNQHSDIEHKYLGGRWPTVNHATDPSLILWENLGYGRIDRCISSFFITLVGIVLVSLGFYGIISLIVWKNSYSSSNALDCGNTLYKKE